MLKARDLPPGWQRCGGHRVEVAPTTQREQRGHVNRHVSLIMRRLAIYWLPPCRSSTSFQLIIDLLPCRRVEPSPSLEAPMQIANGARSATPAASRPVPLPACKCAERELGPAAEPPTPLSGKALGFHSCFTSFVPGGTVLSPFPACL